MDKKLYYVTGYVNYFIESTIYAENPEEAAEIFESLALSEVKIVEGDGLVANTVEEVKHGKED